MDLVVQPSCQTPIRLLSPPRPPSSWVSPKNVIKAPELSLLQTPQVVKVGQVAKFQWVLLYASKVLKQTVLSLFSRLLCGLRSRCVLVICHFHVPALSASPSLGCLWPCVLSHHPTIHPAKQLEAHTCGHAVCFPRTLHHSAAAQQREPNQFHRRGVM